MNETFEIDVFSYNGEVPRVRTAHKIYGKNFAIQTAKEIGGCDNVSRVEMINALTGELIFTIEDGKETFWD